MYKIIVSGSIKPKLRVNGNATLYKGRPLWDIPKTWKKIGVISHSIGNAYNPSIMSIFRVKDKTYRYEIYRDGSIAPFYGKIEFENITPIEDL